MQPEERIEIFPDILSVSQIEKRQFERHMSDSNWRRRRTHIAENYRLSG